MSSPVLFLVGPTASGKSSAALVLARKLNAEIISADSMQVYRGMDVGTAKPSPDERQIVPHHLIDILDPSENFSVHEFRIRALDALRDITGRKKLPMVVGGTGLYVRALIQGLSGQPGGSEVLRRELEAEAQEKGLEPLYRELSDQDAAAAAAIKPGDKRRILRALEIIRLSGKKPSDWYRAREPLSTLGYRPLVFGIQRDRTWLYEKINERVETMFHQGLEAEVRLLMERKLSQTAKQAVGYKELFDLMQSCGNHEPQHLECAKRLIQQRSRNLAKRQMTWFRKEPAIRWIRWGGEEDLVSFCNRLLAMLSEENRNNIK